MVGLFIKQISEDSISLENANKEIAFLNKVSEGLSDVDPLKKVILAITEEFDENG